MDVESLFASKERMQIRSTQTGHRDFHDGVGRMDDGGIGKFQRNDFFDGFKTDGFNRDVLLAD
jgi:hypothetical protein